MKRNLAEGWALLPVSIISSTELTPLEKILLARILGLMNEEGFCFATNSYLAKNIGTTPHSVSNRIQSLEKKKFIYVEYEREGKRTKKRKVFPAFFAALQELGHIVNVQKVEGVSTKSTQNDVQKVEERREYREKSIDIPAKAGSWTKNLLQRYETYRGVKIGNYGRQLQAMKKLKSILITPENIWSKMLELENSSKFWQDNPPDFCNLANNIHKLTDTKLLIRL